MAATAEAGKAISRLKQGLARGLVTGYPNGKKYVPRRCFQEQVTQAMIKQCLPAARNELLDFVSSSATKIFAILVYGNFLDEISLESALQTCRDGHLTDSKLPLPQDHEPCNCDGDRGLCRHAMVQYIKAKWGLYSWEEFWDHQWKFLALELKAGEFEYSLDEQCILPIKLLAGHNKGAFGDVREGKLNTDHAIGFEENGEPRHVAIKEFQDCYENDRQGLDARHAWRLESENLRELSAQNNPHLVHRIAAVAHGEKYLILSDWANGHDLKHFWKQTPKPSVSARLVRDVVAQLSGLASAIKLMHHGYDAGTLSRSVSDSPSLLAVPTSVDLPVIAAPDTEAGRAPEIVTAGSNLSWRHGDLKPENILRFYKPGELVGTLCISDVGLAKRHIVATGVRKDASTTRFATLAYEPPEAVTRIDAPTSRRYDIWSFGCIMLEFVVWLLYGGEGLETFWKLPVENKGTLFWSPGDAESRAVVNRYVTQIMDEVLATNATCRPPSAIGDLLVLVKERVLVPALSGDNTALLRRPRIDAAELLKELQKIENKCEKSEYCYSGPSGHNARLPAVSLLKKTSDSLHPAGAAMAQRVTPYR